MVGRIILKKTIGYLKKNKLNILTLFVTLIITFFIADFVLSFIIPPVHKYEKYGWKIEENRTFEHLIEDSKGNFRDVKINHFDHGFKRWGDPLTNNAKLMVIGDSFTQMGYVSNGEEWYSYLERDFEDLEFFVFGGNGYGTLQEYLVLNDTFDEINPDIILWQFCSNDLVNNHFLFDYNSYPGGSHNYRPYLIDGEVEYRLALPYAKIREASRIGDYSLDLYDRKLQEPILIDRKSYAKKREKFDQQIRERYMGKAYNITSEILMKVRKRTNGIPIFMFNPCDDSEDEISKIAVKNNISYIPGVFMKVKKKSEKLGKRAYVVNNDHWNLLGNKLAGEYLVEFFKKNSFSLDTTMKKSS